MTELYFLSLIFLDIGPDTNISSSAWLSSVLTRATDRSTTRSGKHRNDAPLPRKNGDLPMDD